MKILDEDRAPSGDENFAVNLKDITISFPQPDGTESVILSDITLQIPEGQFVAVVGRSGCGKTTILNLIAGLVKEAAGEVSVLGTDPIAARSGIGFMLARDALLPWRSAAKNVEYGLQLRKVPKAERRARVDRWLAAVHLSHAANQWPWQLSQGMRQRVALARTWAVDPELLLMDEPFAALDAQTRITVQGEFLDLWQSDRPRTVLLVTHDLSEAIALADRVVIVGDGGILDDIMIPFERPRDVSELSIDPDFQQLLHRLHNRIA